RLVSDWSSDVCSSDLEVLEAALRYYQGFLRLRGGDPAARADVAAAHVRVALLTSAVGSKEQALPEYERALALYQELARDAPDNQIGRASGREKEEMPG